MLLLVYRSITSAIMLTMVPGCFATPAGAGLPRFPPIAGLDLRDQPARGAGDAAVTDYATSSPTAATRKHAARPGPEPAYHTMPGGTAHVVLPGPTIAGATFCSGLHPTAYFQTPGVEVSGMVIVVAAALPLGPAIIAVDEPVRLFVRWMARAGLK